MAQNSKEFGYYVLKKNACKKNVNYASALFVEESLIGYKISSSVVDDANERGWEKLLGKKIYITVRWLGM